MNNEFQFMIIDTVHKLDYITLLDRLFSERDFHKSRLEQWKLNPIDFNDYRECHHVQPRFAGGSEKDDNFVICTYEDHINLHLILAKHYTEVAYNTDLYHKAWFAVDAMLMGRSHLDKNSITIAVEAKRKSQLYRTSPEGLLWKNNRIKSAYDRNPDLRIKSSIISTKIWECSKRREKQNRTMKTIMSNVELRERIRYNCKQNMSIQEARDFIRDVNLKRYEDDLEHIKTSIAVKASMTDEVKLKMSNFQNERYSDPEKRAYHVKKVTEGLNTPEYKAKRSQIASDIQDRGWLNAAVKHKPEKEKPYLYLPLYYDVYQELPDERKISDSKIWYSMEEAGFYMSKGLRSYLKTNMNPKEDEKWLSLWDKLNHLLTEEEKCQIQNI